MSSGGLCGRALFGMMAVAFGVTSPVAQTGVVVFHCEPAISHYCQNIHIGCSGRSKRRTTAFQISISGSGAVIQRGGTSTRVELSKRNGEFVLRDPLTGNWVRVLKDRTYAERLQALNPALMTRGTCTDVR